MTNTGYAKSKLSDDLKRLKVRLIKTIDNIDVYVERIKLDQRKKKVLK